jgi:hypothetical protein
MWKNTMNKKLNLLILLLTLAMLSLGCKYIVVPEDLIAKATFSEGWNAVVTDISQTQGGDLHLDITIQNTTGAWSSMNAVVGKPATLTSGSKTSSCDTVFVGTGGYRLAPGLQMRGYTTGTRSTPKIQPLYVECKGGQIEANASLKIDYEYYNGDLDYYQQDANKATGTLEFLVDEPVTGLVYPVFSDIEGLIEPADLEIPAISDNVVKLLDVQRSDSMLEFTWENFNPTNFALKTHIGNPPVIGSDGIIYGIFEIMDLVSVPLTPASGKVTWTTNQSAPPEVNGFYILLSVEAKQMRMYVNHLIDITEY